MHRLTAHLIHRLTVGLHRLSQRATGRPLRDLGDFSLNFTTSLPGGEGGLLITNDEDLWSAPPAGRQIRYDPVEYAEAIHLLDCSRLVGSERYPLCGQDDAVMDYYGAAVHKVYAALEEVLADGSLVDARTPLAPPAE